MINLIKIHGNCEYYKFDENFSDNGRCSNCPVIDGLSPVDVGCECFTSRMM
ncbi:hypothetical protein [Methanobrevibacter sp. YE315]|uniref:hypothetical protein n=1 Tax=Methanobrevibacter sp. YE315 TaxID=1609968 RepID=UPI000AAD2080|nr:hypothetical protein [Methanobrevibacter sp. YE315]